MADSLIPKQEKKIVTDGWAAQTWKVALLTNAFVYDHNVHSTYASLTNEVVGTGYTAGGATLAGKASSYVDTTTVMLDATDLSWGPGATFSNVRYAACYDTVAGLLRALYNIGSTESVSNGTFTLQWHASGMSRIA